MQYDYETTPLIYYVAIIGDIIIMAHFLCQWIPKVLEHNNYVCIHGNASFRSRVPRPIAK